MLKIDENLQKSWIFCIGGVPKNSRGEGGVWSKYVRRYGRIPHFDFKINFSTFRSWKQRAQ